MEDKRNLTIVYEDDENKLHKIKAPKDDFLKKLEYFQSKQNEINQTDLVYIQENISIDLFTKFISSLTTSEIDINEENYEQCLYLCHKYGYKLLEAELKSFIEERPDISNIIDSILLNTNQKESQSEAVFFDQEKEELIAKHLDISIQNGNLRKLPIEILNRILNSPKRTVNDHHLLFSFVFSILKERLNENTKVEDRESLSILPSSLDYTEMDNTEIEKLFNFEKENSLLLFKPRNSTEKIESMIKKEEILKDKCESLEKQMKTINDDLNQKIENLQRQIATSKQDYIDKIENLQRQMTSDKKDYVQRIQKLEDQSKTDKEFFIQKVDVLEKEIKSKEEVCMERIQNLEKKVDDYQCYQEKSLKSENDQIIKRIDELEKKQKDKLSFINCQNEGVFKYLFDKYKTNPVSQDLIEIAGNTYSESYKEMMLNIVDSNWKGRHWRSIDNENSYIQITFKKILVKIMSYHLLTGINSGSYYFRSWKLTGITENNEEVVLDDVNNSSEIKSGHPEITKATQNSSFVRSIKLTMKGKSSDNDYIMVLRNIEIYGILKFL